MKNNKLKMVLLIIFTGLILLLSIGIIELSSLNKLQDMAQTVEMINQIKDEMLVLKISLSISIVILIIASIFIVKIISKMVTKPFCDIIDNSNTFKRSGKNEIKYLDEGKKSSEENIARTINSMTEELQKNLNQVSKQKNQIEAILLHITDGIISFDLEGNVTYINPAAVEFFNLTTEDNTFEKIFKKIDIDVNLEKIVYLDNLTSSEQKVFFNEKYINIFFAP